MDLCILRKILRLVLSFAIIAYLYNHFSKLFVLHQLGSVKEATTETMGWIHDDVSKMGHKNYSYKNTIYPAFALRI